MTYTKNLIIKKLYFLLEKYNNIPFMNLLVTAIQLHCGLPYKDVSSISLISDTDVLKALEDFENNLKGLKKRDE